MKWGHDAKGPTMTKRVDILEQLQCMVNTETPTPLKVVNSMLDLIPESVWLDDNAKILCPACKDGIFLREAVVRILRAKFKQLPDDKNAVYDFTMRQEGILHQILKERIFGIAVSYRGYRVTKRTLYTCNPAFTGIDNIFFDESLGEYVTDKSGAQIEKQCFHFIKDTQAVADFFAKKGVENMKFDVIIGNPPYQLTDGRGGSADGAAPIYNKFIEQAISLAPKYLSFIIPSRWMMGGRGLELFRQKMIVDSRIKEMHDFEDETMCFSGVHIDGGVCYFLWDKDYNGKAQYHYTSNTGVQTHFSQFLKNDYFKFVIRDGRILSMLDKLNDAHKFSELVSSIKPFGIETWLFNEPTRLTGANLSDKPFENSVKIHGVTGVKGGARRVQGYVNKNVVTCNEENVDKYKIFFSKAYSTNAINYPEVILAGPNEICTATFLLIGGFPTKQIRDNCLSYMQTNFFKVLLYFGKGTMNATKSVFHLIPMQNFNEEWTDEKLYKKYNLSENEIAFIESMVKPMDKDTVLSDNIDTDDE